MIKFKRDENGFSVSIGHAEHGALRFVALSVNWKVKGLCVGISDTHAAPSPFDQFRCWAFFDGKPHTIGGLQ